MTCDGCGKACASRSEGRRVSLHGRNLFLCNSCAPDAFPAAGLATGGAGPRRPATTQGAVEIALVVRRPDR